jgi:hypothetical protein
LRAGGFPAARFAAIAFDPAVARSVDSLEAGDFNFFDGALCDAFGEAFPGCLFALLPELLPDLFAAARRVFAAGVLADVIDGARVAFPEEVLEDFLRVFLDIRLPFVAFGGSIIGYCGSCPGKMESNRLLGKPVGPGVWLHGIRGTTHPLVECAPWA